MASKVPVEAIAPAIPTQPIEEAAPAQSPGRRPELDALRLLVIFGLIPVHAAYIFVPFFDYYLRGTEILGFTVFVVVAVIWAMPLLFTTSGMALRFALRSRSAGQIIHERITRLLVPFVFGVIVVVPPLTYIDIIANDGYTGSYWTFLGRFFDIRLSWDFPYFFTGRNWMFEVAHLYFLYLLFVYTLLLLPVLLFLRSERGARAKAAITGWLTKPIALAFLGVPIVVLQAMLGGEDKGGWDRWVYLLCVLYGYLFALDERVMRVISARWRTWLVVAAVATFALFPFGLYLDEIEVDGLQDPEVVAVLWRVVMGVGGWFSILAILGGTARALRGRRAVEDVARSGGKTRLARLGVYAQDAVLPVYVLHLTVVIAVAYYVLAWPVNAFVQFLAIVSLSFVFTLLLFEIARRNPVARFLLGIKSRHK